METWLDTDVIDVTGMVELLCPRFTFVTINQYRVTLPRGIEAVDASKKK